MGVVEVVRVRIRRLARVVLVVVAVGGGVTAAPSAHAASDLGVTSVDPAVVRGSVSNTITAQGYGFTSNMTILVRAAGDPSWNSASRFLATYVSPSSATFALPAGYGLGTYDVMADKDTTGSPPCYSCLHVTRQGYWMLGADGAVYAFGDAPNLGDPKGWIGPRLGSGVRAVSITGLGSGYCVVDSLGEVFCYQAGSGYYSLPAGSLARGETVTSMSPRPDSPGQYWFFTNFGRVFTGGGGPSFGDMSATRLNGPVLDSSPTPTGQGYYMVASDGGVFSFGDAQFRGSMGGHPLNGPIQALAPDGTNLGYWLVASDGGIFAFGDAQFHGSMGGQPLNKPIVGMVPYGNGYLMVASDGGIFDFSDRPFMGSLGNNPPAVPIVAAAPLPG